MEVFMTTLTSTRLVSAMALTAALGLPGIASADFVNFASATGDGTVGIFQSGSVDFGGGAITATPQPDGRLTVANYTVERGLGVCSSGESSLLCNNTKYPNTQDWLDQGSSIWRGEIDELDTRGNNASIKLTANNGIIFDGIFRVGSLDNNGASTPSDADRETGTLSTSGGALIATFNTAGVDIAATYQPILGLTGALNNLDSPNIGYYEIVLTGFSQLNLSEVVFGAVATTNNANKQDYLVAGASVVPIPAAAWLFGSALVGFIGLGRRKLASAA
jgi:hypothetical protein